MKKMSGAEAVIDALVREGVTHVYGLSGSDIIEPLEVIDRRGDIKFILTRHEQGASFMALGHARASRIPGVCMCTIGPGATNMLTGVAGAYRAMLPMIAITGKHERWLTEREPLQDLDQVSIYRPVTKWSEMVFDPDLIPEAMHKAFRVSLTGRPGPVHLAIPRDVLQAEIEVEPLDPRQYRPTDNATCSESRLDEVVSLLEQAKRPVILAGWEVLWEEASPRLVELAELLSIPVTTAQETPDVFPTDHPLSLGPLGRAGWDPATSYVPGADVILAIGLKFDWGTTLLTHQFISRDARIIHISQYPEFLGAIYPEEVSIAGSSRAFMDLLLARVKARHLKVKKGDVSGLRKAWNEKRAAELSPTANPIKVPHLARMVRKLMKRDGNLVLDGGNACIHVRRHFDFYQPGTYTYMQDLGAIGLGLPVAMGVKVARPEREVVCLAGDAGFMMNAAELETAVREHVKVTVVVMNDMGLGQERAHERRHYPGRYFAVDYGDVDFGKLAESMGAWGTRVTAPSELEDALQAALKSDRAAVVDVVIDKEDLAPAAAKVKTS